MKLVKSCLLVLLAATAIARAETQSFSGGTIWTGPKPSSLEQQAAQEVRTYLYRISGKVLPVRPLPMPSGKKQPAILVGTIESLGSALKPFQSAVATVKKGKDEGFIMQSGSQGGAPYVLLLAKKPVGALYAAYTFLEKMGIGFYFGGDTLPGTSLPLAVGSMKETWNPSFATRGTIPWFNFLNGPTTWNIEDYRYFFDQMVKQKCNFVGFHSYDNEPFCAYESGGKFLMGEPLDTSMGYKWRPIPGRKTTQFGFGTGDFFDSEVFGSKAVVEAKDGDDSIRRAQKLLAEGMTYAKKRGIKVALGFELTGDPTDAKTAAAFKDRLSALVKTYPMLDYIWLWHAENAGLGADLPNADSALKVQIGKYRETFSYLKYERRIQEAVRLTVYLDLAQRVIEQVAPDKRLMIGGWGGDEWLRFTDFMPGMDKLLPKDIIFTSLDNIDPSWEPKVSENYAKLSPDREKWPITWFESDGAGSRHDQWAPQCNVKPFSELLPDVKKKGCQGLLGIHWRVRDVEDVASYQFKFAWNPRLTYEGFFDDYAARTFGKADEKDGSRLLRELEALGPRYTGGSGQCESGPFWWFSDSYVVEGHQNQINLETGQIDWKTAQKRPIPENMEGLQRVIQWLGSHGDSFHSDRVERLSNTVTWLLYYDQAAVLENDAETKTAEAEKLLRDGKQDQAKELARQAWQQYLAGSGPFEEAMRTYTHLLCTQGDWGVLATWNIKGYEAFDQLKKRLVGLLGDEAQDMRPESSAMPQITVKQPPTLAFVGEPITMEAVALGGESKPSGTIFYRALGDKDYKSVKMDPVRAAVLRGTIPGAAVTTRGIEFYIEAAVGNPNLKIPLYSPGNYKQLTYAVTVVK